MKRPLHICWTGNVIGTGDDRGYILHASFIDSATTLCGYGWQECSPRILADTSEPDCEKCRKILAKLREQWAGELPLTNQV